MTQAAEIIIEAQLHVSRGWSLTKIILDADGVELERGLAAGGLFQSSASAREWFDQTYATSRIPARFEKRKS